MTKNTIISLENEKRRSMIQKMNLVISVKQNNIDIGLL